MALPDRVYAHASPASVLGRSIFRQGNAIHSFNVASFASQPDVTVAATARLQAAGFEILQVTPISINFAGSPDMFEKTFRTRLVQKEVARPNGDSVTYLDSPDTDTLGLVSTFGTPLGDVLEGVALEVPRLLFDASSTPPRVDYWHLDVPADVALACNATALHRLGITGAGVTVAMVDSGWFRHPYFTAQGYNVAPVVLGPGASLPESDESGHGTGESANVMAIAPNCQLLPVKANFVNTTGAFNAAVALNPDIITCSWGSHTPFVLSAADMVLAASVAAAVASGITVIFSAGNGHAGFPGQHPDVISAGGVFMHPDGSLEASNYSSGFVSTIYPGRRVPDVCGLVGQRPKALYIMLPVEPGDSIDAGNAGGIFPDGDQTAADDGWAAFSGTSAAAPQLAGVAALVRQVVPNITPASMKAALSVSAIDVSAGTCSPVMNVHNGLPAVPGPDDATGNGLINAFSAVVSAYVASVIGFYQTAAPYEGAAAESSASKAAAAYYQGLAYAAAAMGLPQAIADYYRGIGEGYAALASLYTPAAAT